MGDTIFATVLPAGGKEGRLSGRDAAGCASPPQPWGPSGSDAAASRDAAEPRAPCASSARLAQRREGIQRRGDGPPPSPRGPCAPTPRPRPRARRARGPCEPGGRGARPSSRGTAALRSRGDSRRLVTLHSAGLCLLRPPRGGDSVTTIRQQPWTPAPQCGSRRLHAAWALGGS